LEKRGGIKTLRVGFICKSRAGLDLEDKPTSRSEKKKRRKEEKRETLLWGGKKEKSTESGSLQKEVSNCSRARGRLN